MRATLMHLTAALLAALQLSLVEARGLPLLDSLRDAAIRALTPDGEAVSRRGHGHHKHHRKRPAPPSDCAWIPALAERDRRQGPAPRPGNDVPPKDVVFFTDGTNFDDVVTLLWLAKTPRANLKAIYLQGNAWASPGSSFRHMFNILHMMSSKNHNIPIFAGSYYALADELEAAATGAPTKISYRLPVPQGPSGILFSDSLHGMGHFLPQSPIAYDIRKTPDTDDASIPAFYQLVDGMPAGTNLTVVTTGTLTPIAKMFTDKHSTPAAKLMLQRVGEVVVLGGAVDVDGNLFSKPINKKAEFNIYNDPHASQWALKNLTDAGVPVTLVPLDATNTVPLQERLLNALYHHPATPEAQLTGQLMENLHDTWYDPAKFFNDAYLWDVSAAIAMLYPDVIASQQKRLIRVVIDEGPDGPNQGWTKPCDDKSANKDCSLVKVIKGFDADAVTDELLNTLQDPVGSAELGLVCL